MENTNWNGTLLIKFCLSRLVETKILLYSHSNTKAIVETTGWIGFGLSPNGGMPGSDIVMAWIDADGTKQFSDRHAIAQATPIVDEHQDWELISMEENNGVTLVSFKRDLLS